MNQMKMKMKRKEEKKKVMMLGLGEIFFSFFFENGGRLACVVILVHCLDESQRELWEHDWCGGGCDLRGGGGRVHSKRRRKRRNPRKNFVTVGFLQNFSFSLLINKG